MVGLFVKSLMHSLASRTSMHRTQKAYRSWAPPCWAVNAVESLFGGDFQVCQIIDFLEIPVKIGNSKTSNALVDGVAENFVERFWRSKARVEHNVGWCQQCASQIFDGVVNNFFHQIFIVPFAVAWFVACRRGMHHNVGHASRTTVETCWHLSLQPKCRSTVRASIQCFAWPLRF